MLSHFCICIHTVYPIYIGVAQAIAIFMMKSYQKVLCCCKKRYLVEDTYDPNSTYQIKAITERYVCEEDGDLNRARRVSIMTNKNNEQVQKIEVGAIKFVDVRGVEYLWTDEWIYFFCGLFITFIESMRISGILVLKDDIGQVALSVSMNIIIEVLQRNNLIWEIVYRCCCKKKNPDRCKFDTIYYGAMWQWTYMPLQLLFLMNILEYGPSNPKEDCYKDELEDLYDLLPGYGWIMIVIFLQEVMSDIASLIIQWALRMLQWIPIDPKDDGARRIYIIRMGVFGIAVFWISAIAVSENGYEMDLSITKLLDGEDSVVDDLYKRFFS